MSGFGTLVRERRLGRGLSVRDLEAMTGVSYPYISLIERGKRQPSRDKVEALTTALDLDMRDAFLAAGYAPPDALQKAAVPVPVHAAIPAGNPSDVDETPDGHGFLPAGEVEGTSLYYVRACGDSLRDAGVHNGDLVLVDAGTRTPRVGQLVVARQHTASMLRFWYPENNHVVLRSANPEYPDLHVTEVEVLGVAIGYFAKF